MSKSLYYGLANRIIRENELPQTKIDYILVKNNEQKKTVRIITHDFEDDSDIIQIDCNNGNVEICNIAEYDFNCDTYLFEDLKNGFEIDYMCLEIHYGVWNQVDDFRWEVDCVEGMQKYLAYCQRENITSSTISALHLNDVDIMDLYVETNAGYRIIADISCNNNAIVLGYRKGAVQEYVTWSTTCNRKNGYDLGHYFNSYKKAYKDFQERVNYMVDKSLEFQKLKSKPKEKENER